QMPIGMVVLNRRHELTSLNPAARRILGLTDSHPVDPSLHQMLPLDAINFEADEAAQIEVMLGQPTMQRDCLLTAAILQDWRGRDVGYLLLLDDITAQKQAQAQLIAQQRALATMQERERLARELHDSLGQSLAATHLQASVARQLLAQGRIEQSDACLAFIAELSLEAEADVRDYLLGAKIAVSPDTPFVSTVRHYVERFAQQYQLQIELDTPPVLEGTSLGFALEVQLLRIIQEALSNVRKHAGAQRVQIRFAVTETLAEVTISDDGHGFDSTLVPQSDGFGLYAMRERAATVGGTLTLQTAPGAGTQISVRIPL
ncbi:MAG: PAS domain-containing sensor histidine kinase, partial [Chloroflexia bacterium]|nr:PAS domain-containing sensor histidine kinase [Chloroflexia bacterium]